MTPLVEAMIASGDAPPGIIEDALRDQPDWNEGDPLTTAYVVSGESGEYSDHREWLVSAFLVREKADRQAEELNRWCRDNGCYWDEVGPYEDRPSSCPLDPGFRVDYTGVRYTVYELPLMG